MASGDDWRERVRVGYDAVVEAYAQARSGFRERSLVERCIQGLPPGARILDVGC